MSATKTSDRVEIVDALRGVAALAVCWFHFTQGVGEFLPEGLLKKSGAYGFLGVQVFFVVSGFVIPFTLAKSSYTPRDYFRFIARRIVRLDPPYFVSLALVLLVGFALMHLTNSHAGRPPFQSYTQLALHIGYINALFGYEWLNPIYWTLAIEFQYYLFLGLLFPLLFGSNKALRITTALVLCALPYLNQNHSLVFWYFPWFLFGVYACYFNRKEIGRPEYIVALAVLGVFSIKLYGLPEAGVLTATSLLISFYRGKIGRVLSFFGMISYSLYLTHAPIGCTFINLSNHFEPGYADKLVVLFLAAALTISASYLMFRFVEKPALNLASRIRYRRFAPAQAKPDTAQSASAGLS